MMAELSVFSTQPLIEATKPITLTAMSLGRILAKLVASGVEWSRVESAANGIIARQNVGNINGRQTSTSIYQLNQALPRPWVYHPSHACYLLMR